MSLNCFFDKVEKYRNESEKSLRKDNFIATNKEEIHSVDNVKYCSLSSVIKLCYFQKQKHLGCAKICQQIETLIVHNDVKTDSALDLYNRIAKFSLKKN